MSARDPIKSRKKRGHRISVRELVVGLGVAFTGYLFEVFAISHHPDIRVFLSHILEPVLVMIILALMAGFSWPAAWAFFRSSLKTGLTLGAAVSLGGGITVLVLAVLDREPIAVIVAGVLAGVATAFVISVVLALRSVNGKFGPPDPVPDENLPFVSWTWGVPVPAVSDMPGIGPAEDPEWERGWKEAFGPNPPTDSTSKPAPPD